MKLLLPLFLLAAVVMQGAEPMEFKLWTQGAPGRMLPPSKDTAVFIRAKAGKGAITDHHEPTITLHRPEKPNGTSVIVAPGGGFAFLSAMHEGTQVCEWLNSLGVTAILLKYRTPTRDDPGPHDKPVQDALRAIFLVRQNAEAWKLDPLRVGLLGFGAGGNVAVHVACDRAWAGQRSDFSILIYGSALEDPTEPPRLGESFRVPPDAPPLFMASTHGNEAAFRVLTTLHLEHAMVRPQKQMGDEVHLFSKGGSDFGLQKEGQPADGWPQRCAQWMDAAGWLPKQPTVAGVQAQVAQVDARLAELREESKKLQDVTKLFAGNDCPTDYSQKLLDAKLELLKAERAGDKAKIDEAKAWITEWERMVKMDDEYWKALEQLHDEIDVNKGAIRKLEAERVQLLQTLEQDQPP